mmetsp:Transcript_15409/g.36802  ORF Transcript_15409/g.36802 Transcript_15409/m.36802 type:complete len:125 (+) Transcript_15409:195-569(+)
MVNSVEREVTLSRWEERTRALAAEQQETVAIAIKDEDEPEETLVAVDYIDSELKARVLGAADGTLTSSELLHVDNHAPVEAAMRAEVRAWNQAKTAARKERKERRERTKAEDEKERAHRLNKRR